MGQQPRAAQAASWLREFALDADGDRGMVLVYDAGADEVRIIDGDRIAFLLLRTLGDRCGTAGRVFAGTVESDLAVFDAAGRLGVETVLTPVGDKWLSSPTELRERLLIGEEPSGHIVWPVRIPTETGEVTVLLGQGNVSLYTTEGVGLRVKAGVVSVVPAAGYKTLGEVALLNGAVVVTAKEGKLRVEGNGPAVEVVKGKTITVLARSPQGGAAGAGGGGGGMSTSTALQIGAIAAGGTSTVMSGIAISRARDARDAAAAANTTAGSGVTAANAAKAAADAAQATANAAGCALNTAFPDVSPSPYTPPAGLSCP
jgi:hypothetical protein